MDVAADGVARVVRRARSPRTSRTTYFLRLELDDAAGRAASAANFYWLSTREDVLDWKKTEVVLHARRRCTPT